MLSIIVAKSKNNVIGKDNRLIWYLPDDLKRFKQITKERYYITKYTNTSYLDVGKITPTERDLLMSFIKEDLEKTKESLEKSKKDIESASAGIPAQRR